MDSGIYCLKWPPSGFFYIGKSDNIPKRWKQHETSFLKGTHSRRMQEQYDVQGAPEYTVFLRCHSDHVDLYESIIIRHNLGPHCLNGALPREVPEEQRVILLEAAEYIKMPTATHIELLKTTEKLLLESTARLKELQTQGVKTPYEHQQKLKTYGEKVTHLEAQAQIRLQELKRLQKLNWFSRIFNYKVHVV